MPRIDDENRSKLSGNYEQDLANRNEKLRVALAAALVNDTSVLWVSALQPVGRDGWVCQYVDMVDKNSPMGRYSGQGVRDGLARLLETGVYIEPDLEVWCLIPAGVIPAKEIIRDGQKATIDFRVKRDVRDRDLLRRMRLELDGHGRVSRAVEEVLGGGGLEATKEVSVMELEVDGDKLPGFVVMLNSAVACLNNGEGWTSVGVINLVG